MTPEQVCEKLGGTKSLNRMKARVDGKLEIIARLNGHTYEFTPVGAAQAAKFNAERAVGISTQEEPKPKPRRKPKPVQDDLFADKGSEDTVDLPTLD